MPVTDQQIQQAIDSFGQQLEAAKQAEREGPLADCIKRLEALAEEPVSEKQFDELTAVIEQVQQHVDALDKALPDPPEESLESEMTFEQRQDLEEGVKGHFESFLQDTHQSQPKTGRSKARRGRRQII